MVTVRARSRFALSRVRTASYPALSASATGDRHAADVPVSAVEDGLLAASGETRWPPLDVLSTNSSVDGD